MTSPSLPSVWTSTNLAILKECPFKFRVSILDGWSLKHDPKIHLGAGGTFASAIEATRRAHYVSGQPEDLAIAEGALVVLKSDLAWGSDLPSRNRAKGLEGVLYAFLEYWTQWPLTASAPIVLPSAQGIEFSFAEELPFPELDRPLFIGRADAILEQRSGTWIVDEKTCSGFGPSWADQWQLRSQFIGYSWAADRMGLSIRGTAVRGVAMLIGGPEFAEALNFMPHPRLINDWLDSTEEVLLSAQTYAHKNFWPKALGEPCNAYGGCQFRNVCLSRFPQERLESDFEQSWYNPLTRERQSSPWWES